MALRDQPYLPLYIKDIMTDEKLNECCAATHGIYIKGIMCLMHKSEPYGKILLKQKYKQTSSKEKNFALQLAKQLPYSVEEIFAALSELISENVCQFDDEYLVQKRMVIDGELSDKRAKAGKKGGENSHKFAQANNEANAEYEYGSKSEAENINEFTKEGGLGEGKNIGWLVNEMHKHWILEFPHYTVNHGKDTLALVNICSFITEQAKVEKVELPDDKAMIFDTFKLISNHIKTDGSWWADKSLSTIANHMQEFYNAIKSSKNGAKSKPKNGHTAKPSLDDVSEAHARRYANRQ